MLKFFTAIHEESVSIDSDINLKKYFQEPFGTHILNRFGIL